MFLPKTFRSGGYAGDAWRRRDVCREVACGASILSRRGRGHQAPESQSREVGLSCRAPRMVSPFDDVDILRRDRLGVHCCSE